MPKFAIMPVTALALAAAAAFCRVRGDALDMPRAGGSDAVAVLFGDVRMLIGRRMIGKADEYFHGGVTELNCSLEHHHHDHGHAHDDGDDHDHGHNDFPCNTYDHHERGRRYRLQDRRSANHPEVIGGSKLWI